VALKKFHENLEKLVVFSQDWGIGCDGHGGFNEPGYDPLSKDQVVRLNDLTLVQNVNAFLRPEEEKVSSIFRNWAAEKQIYSFEELKKDMGKECKQEDWNYMEKMVQRMPPEAVTQGIGSAIGRGIYQVVMAEAKRKSWAVARGIEGPVSSRATISGLQLAPRVVYVVEKEAAGQLKNLDEYFKLNLPDLGWGLEDVYRTYVKRGKEQGKTVYELAAELNETEERVQMMSLI
jgi:hypothetical protein